MSDDALWNLPPLPPPPFFRYPCRYDYPIEEDMVTDAGHGESLNFRQIEEALNEESPPPFERGGAGEPKAVSLAELLVGRRVIGAQVAQFQFSGYPGVNDVLSLHLDDGTCVQFVATFESSMVKDEAGQPAIKTEARFRLLQKEEPEEG